MYKPKLEKEIRCPLEYGLDIFGGKWNPRIICLFEDFDVLRYGEIREKLIGVTDTILSATLKKLVANKIIHREQFNEIPQRVEYSLTEKGKSVIPILGAICNWSGAYFTEDSGSVLGQCAYCMYREDLINTID